MTCFRCLSLCRFAIALTKLVLGCPLSEHDLGNPMTMTPVIVTEIDLVGRNQTHFLPALKVSAVPATFHLIEPISSRKITDRSAFIGSTKDKLLTAPLVIEECIGLVRPALYGESI